METNTNTTGNSNIDNRNGGGRKAGVPNKISSKLREQLADILELGLDQFMIDLECLKAKERVDAYLQIAKFVIPTMKAVEVTDVTPQDQRANKFVFEFVDKDGE